jgi:DNA-binding response OmpR family regulator
MAAVLVIDDDADLLEAVAEVLLSEGFAVDRAQGGAAALRFLESGALPEAVLLDVRMDDLDGRAVSLFIRANPATRGVPIVFMTGDRHFRSGDGAHVLEKPFGVQELLAAVRAALANPAIPAGCLPSPAVE